MTVKDLEEITNRHEGLIATNTATLQQHSVVLAEIQETLKQILSKLASADKGKTPLQSDPRLQHQFAQQQQPHIQGRPLHLDLPRFEGTEPEGWIFQVEQFFALNPIPPEQRVTMASIHLRGDAVAWYRWLHQSMGELTWRQFSTTLCKRFGSRKNLDPMSALSKLTQSGTVSSYITQFENMINLVPGLQDNHQVSLFLSGLRADIQAGVRLLTPTSLSHAFDLALCQEDAITATNAFAVSSSTNLVSSSTNLAASSTSLASSSTNPSPVQAPHSTFPKPLPENPALPTGVKRLTWAEQQKRREKGLCFNCDETYKPGHRCATPHLLLMDASSAKTNPASPTEPPGEFC